MSHAGQPSPADPHRFGGSTPAPPPPPYGQAPIGAQPAVSPAHTTAPTQPPPNYLVWGVLTTLFCFLPLGIASIVFATQVNTKYAAGDLAGAQRASNKAKQFAIWAGIAGAALAFLVLAAAGSGGSEY